MNIGLTTIKNFLINYKNPKCLAITKDEYNKYSIMNAKDWHSFTDINMSPRFYKDNYYNKSNDEFSIPNYEKTIKADSSGKGISFDRYYITKKEPMFIVLSEIELHDFFSIYDLEGFIAKKPFFTTNQHINIDSSMNLRLVKTINKDLMETTRIYCLPEFNTDEIKLLLEIGG